VSCTVSARITQQFNYMMHQNSWVEAQHEAKAQTKCKGWLFAYSQISADTPRLPRCLKSDCVSHEACNASRMQKTDSRTSVSTALCTATFAHTVSTPAAPLRVHHENMTTMTRITSTAQKRVAGGSNRALLTLVLEPMQYMQDCVLYRRQVEVKGE
jgi:hypothetical protein